MVRIDRSPVARLVAHAGLCAGLLLGACGAALAGTPAATAPATTPAAVAGHEGALVGREIGAGPFRRRPLFLIEEYHLVLPGKRDLVVDYYRRQVLPVLRTYGGYLGFAVLDASPEQSKIADRELAAFVGIGADPIQPHEGVVLDGAVRTDRQINFHAAIRPAFNLMFRHYIADEKTFRALIGHDSASGGQADSLAARWRERYGTAIWDTLAKEYFVHMRNHYDIVYTFAVVE